MKNNKRANGTTSQARERDQQATLDIADAPACDNGGGGAGIGNPPVPREDDCADSGRLRIDSGVVTSSDIAQERVREISTLDWLDSTPATTRKTIVFADQNTATSASATQPAASYLIVDLDLVNELLDSTQCKTCGGDIKLATGDHNYGLATKLALLCKCNKVRRGGTRGGLRAKKNATPLK